MPTTRHKRTSTFQLSQSGTLVRCPTSTRSGSRQGRPLKESPASTTRPRVAEAIAWSRSGRGAASINSRDDGATTNASSASPTCDPSGRRAVTVALYAPGGSGGNTTRAFPSGPATAEPAGRGTGSSADDSTTAICAPAAAP